MKILALGVLFAGMGLAVANPGDTLPSPAAGAVYAAAAAPERAAERLDTEALTDVVQSYCVVCHNDQLMTGNLSLQAFDVERASDEAETAERMIRKLRAGLMPPPGIPRPGGDTLRMLAETLESTVDEAARAAPKLGERRFQRVNRAEYGRLVHELLALEVDASKWLPIDLLLGSFDNQSAAQPFSATLMQAFVTAGSEVARMAVGVPEAVSATTKFLHQIRASQHAWTRVEGAPYGTRGGMVVTATFPADGEYVFEIFTSQGVQNTVAIDDIDISVDGEPLAFAMLEHNATRVTGRSIEGATTPAVTTDPLFVRAGQHTVSVAFVNRIVGPYEDRFQVPEYSAVGLVTDRNAVAIGGRGGVVSHYGGTGVTHVSELWITGPSNVSGVSESPSRAQVFTCRPNSPAEERPCAESILTRLMIQANRRPAAAGDVAGVMALYDEAAAKDGGFEMGVRTGLQAILTSPHFLFRMEEVADARPGELYRLSDLDLASRLSFFLWTSAPDAGLLELAQSGRLSDPTVLERQVERMLEDPRSETLATRFAHQWLQLQNITKVWPQAYFYPDFTEQLAGDMVRETELFFQHLVQEERGLFELFSADYTFLNERLARHYDIPGVFGDEFRRVQYPADVSRMGVLSHASVLKLTSMSDRTSPVLRGKWVMTQIMGTPPPPPPPNVPPFEASPDGANGRRLTTRERMEVHRSAVVCNSCHRFMDPIGLALDNFDATGRWRIRENMAPLDTRGDFYDGTPISNPIELANVLLKRPIPLVRNFTENLLAYALGRGLEYYDQPTVRAIGRAAEPDYRFSSLIMGVVKSDPFQMRQAPTTAN